MIVIQSVNRPYYMLWKVLFYVWMPNHNFLRKHFQFIVI